MNKATVLKSVTAVVGAGVAAYCGQLAARDRSRANKRRDNYGGKL